MYHFFQEFLVLACDPLIFMWLVMQTVFWVNNCSQHTLWATLNACVLYLYFYLYISVFVLNRLLLMGLRLQFCFASPPQPQGSHLYCVSTFPDFSGTRQKNKMNSWGISSCWALFSKNTTISDYFLGGGGWRQSWGYNLLHFLLQPFHPLLKLAR